VDKGGLVSEADYPYSGRDGTCKLTDGLKIAAKVDNFSRVAVDEKQVRAALTPGCDEQICVGYLPRN
jgi:cathepsin F